MNDIIDINVNKTVEQVEITVTENLTTVNINTQTGVDAYTKDESDDKYIPYTGTPTGKPITGDLEFDTYAGKLLKITSSDPDYETYIFGDDGNFFIRTENLNTGYFKQISLGGDNTDYIGLDSNNPSFTGFKLNTDLSANIADLDYTQKIYVDTGLSTKLDASAYNDRFKGKFTSLLNLESVLPTANAGDYAQVDTGSGFDVQNYNYDLEDGWVLGGTGSGATSTDTLIEGTTNLYFTTARVLSTLLSGLSLATGGTILITDSVLVAFGKLQKQINDILLSIYWTKSGSTVSNIGGASEIVSAGGQRFGNLGSNFFAEFFRNSSSSISAYLGSGLQFTGWFINNTFGAQFVNQTRHLFSIGNFDTFTTPLEVGATKIIATVPLQIPPATASNEAVNLSQLQSENNVYNFHDFLTTNSNELVTVNFLGAGGLFSNTVATSTVNNPGVARITSGTVANSGISLRSIATNINLKGQEVCDFIINPLTFTNTLLRLGFFSNTDHTTPLSGVYFQYSGSGVLTLITADNGVTTTSSTITTLVVSTFYKLKITVNSNATSVLAEVFNNLGVLISSVTQTTNIPTTARFLNYGLICTNSGTNSTALLDVDFMDLKQILTR